MEERLKLMQLFKSTMILIGLWRLKITDNALFRTLYFFYSIGIQTLFSLMFFGSLGNISEAMSNDDYPGVIDNIWFSLLTLLVCIKLLMWQRGSFADLVLKGIAEEERIYSEESDSIKDTFEKNYKIVKNFIVLAFVCTFSSGFLVWICDTIKYIQYRHLNETETKPMMTLHVRYPLNRNKYFFGTYILSLSTTLSGAIYTTISQVYFIVLTAFIISQLKVVKRLTREFHLYGESEYNEKDILAAFRNIYNKHLYIIEFVDEVNLAIKYLILTDCMVNSIIIAFLIVQVLFVATSFATLMFYIAVSCTVLSQIFIISWIANEIEMESTSVSDALFESRWWEQTQKVKQVIIIIMMRSRQPLRIMIGPFYPLTIQTALNSLRAAYSYVTLIFAMSSRDELQT